MPAQKPQGWPGLAHLIPLSRLSSDLSGPSLSKSSPDASPVTQGLGLSQLVTEDPDGSLKGFLPRFCPFMGPEIDLGAWVGGEQRVREAVLPAVPPFLLESWAPGLPVSSEDRPKVLTALKASSSGIDWETVCTVSEVSWSSSAWITGMARRIPRSLPKELEHQGSKTKGQEGRQWACGMGVGRQHNKPR